MRQLIRFRLNDQKKNDGDVKEVEAKSLISIDDIRMHGQF